MARIVSRRAAWLSWCSLAVPTVVLAAVPNTPVDGPALLLKHCGGCHAGGVEEGGLAIDALLAALPVPGGGDRPAGRDHARWVAVWRNIRAETMPPADEGTVAPADRQALERFVVGDVLGVDPAQPDPGRSVLRRLNRVEYANTVRDLTGLEINVIDDLPADDTGHGFDTIGEVLSMSPLLVEKYVALAERVGDALVVAAVATPDPKTPSAPASYPASIRRLFSEGPPLEAGVDRDGHRARTLRRLADRAFRRPAEAATVDALVGIARRAETAPGGSFEKGVAAALVATLASPRFLFRIESPAAPQSPAAGATAVLLDDHALASRLSYFLWSSMPDDELFAVAGAGRLHDEVAAQVERMLADRRSSQFVRNFVGQWLQTNDVQSLPVDARQVLARADRKEAERVFNQDVRKAMREETEMLFAHVLRERLPATDLLVGRSTFLNADLARFYGIEGVEGPQMRLVDVGPETHRGGLLTHGGLLFVTSNPTRTSPVKRGLFILDNLLGTPAPPPPPDVPPFEKAAQHAGRQPSMREVMELHRRDPLCASCHARMDPLGLTLETYNAVGQWRGDAAADIDTAGRLVTGESFANVRELADVIANARRRDFHRCLVEKLLTYATGRGIEYFDAPAVDKIVGQAGPEGRLFTIVQGVVESVPFRMCRPGAGLGSP